MEVCMVAYMGFLKAYSTQDIQTFQTRIFHAGNSAPLHLEKVKGHIDVI